MLRYCIAVLGVLASCAASAAPWPRALPDPCVSVRDDGPLRQVDLPATTQTNFWNLAYPEAYAGNESALRGVVFIVNANGASDGVYRKIGEHLARQDFLVRLIERPAGTFATTDVQARMAETFAQYALPANFPVVLIGHSKGGGSVLEVTRLYSYLYNIDAVVNIAPNADGALGFLGTDAPAYLALYGSQDEDMAGTTGDPREAFMAYDLVNIESTTASPSSRYVVVTANMVDKAMVYVRGADHSGFVRHEGLNAQNAYRDYLSRDDQFCIGKAYVTAFLDWKLGGETGYRAMFRGTITPPSVSTIQTDAPDYAGNPAGQPVALFHQFSPRKRFVIADFWSTPTISAGIDMQASVVYPFTVDDRARHETKALRIGWKSNALMRYTAITVPANRRNLAAFDHFQFRIGQIDTGNASYANAAGTEPAMVVSLVDGTGASASVVINNYGPIPGPDPRLGGGAGHSHMNTISIPMADLDAINLGDVRYVRFWVYPSNRGEVMIDNIEAVYD